MGLDRRSVVKATMSALCLPLVGAPVKAAAKTVTVFSVNGVKPVMVTLQPDYAAKSGVDLQFTFGTIGALYDRLKGGASADILMSPNDGIDTAAQRGLFKPVGTTLISKTGLGVAVRKGEPVPDISTREKFRDLLLRCKSIAFTDPTTGAASGVAFEKIISELGIANEVKAKAKISATVPVGEIVARGEAEVGVQQATELAPVAGISIAPAFPADLQRVTVYRAAASDNAPPQAAEFIKYLLTSEAQAYFIKAGFSQL